MSFEEKMTNDIPINNETKDMLFYYLEHILLSGYGTILGGTLMRPPGCILLTDTATAVAAVVMVIVVVGGNLRPVARLTFCS